MLRLLAACTLAAAALAGCDSPCLDIQQVLCECEGRTQEERNTCNDAASAQEDLSPPTDEEIGVCESLLPKCEEQVLKGCETLRTPEGRRACGLAP